MINEFIQKFASVCVHSEIKVRWASSRFSPGFSQVTNIKPSEPSDGRIFHVKWSKIACKMALKLWRAVFFSYYPYFSQSNWELVYNCFLVCIFWIFDQKSFISFIYFWLIFKKISFWHFLRNITKEILFCVSGRFRTMLRK